VLEKVADTGTGPAEKEAGTGGGAAEEGDNTRGGAVEEGCSVEGEFRRWCLEGGSPIPWGGRPSTDAGSPLVCLSVSVCLSVCFLCVSVCLSLPPRAPGMGGGARGACSVDSRGCGVEAPFCGELPLAVVAAGTLSVSRSRRRR